MNCKNYGVPLLSSGGVDFIRLVDPLVRFKKTSLRIQYLFSKLRPLIDASC